MSTIVNLSVDQYSKFATIIQIIDNSGNVKDLSNCTAKAQMRKSYSSFANVEFTANIDNPDEGEIELSLSSAQTANIKYGRYVYDLVLISNVPGIDNERVVEGIVTVNPGVTLISS